MRPHRLVLAIGLLAVLGSTPEAAQTVDISGTWSFSFDVGDSHGEPVFSFEQKGETLSGTVAQPRGKGQKVTGTIKNDRAVFGFEGVREGESFKADYTGTIGSATRMSGTVEFSGALAGMGTWTATKK